jgi:hypothetical protein
MNRAVSITALVALFGVATAAIEQIADPRWRALAALAALLAGWLVGWHTPAPGGMAAKPEAPPSERPTDPEVQSTERSGLEVQSGEHTTALDALTDEIRGYRGEVRTVLESSRRAGQLAQETNALVKKLVPRVDALERAHPELAASKTPSIP